MQIGFGAFEAGKLEICGSYSLCVFFSDHHWPFSIEDVYDRMPHLLFEILD